MEIICLDEGCLHRALLNATLFVERDIGDAGFEPMVIIEVLAIKEVRESCTFDVGHDELACHKGFYLFDEALLGFCKTEGVNQISLRGLLDETAFQGLVVTNLAFKPFTLHTFSYFLVFLLSNCLRMSCLPMLRK